MTSRIQPEIACADPLVWEMLVAWLDSSLLEWPGDYALHVDVVDVLPSYVDTREEFLQPGLVIQAGAPDETVRIRWTQPEAMAVIHPTEAHAQIWLTPAAVSKMEVAERGFLLVTLLFVLRRVGWYHVHGAALVDPTNRGWLFIGHSKSGKSTTSALCAANGWAVSTDDIAFLSAHDGDVWLQGFHAPIALREGGRSLLGAGGGIDFSRRGKTGYTTDALGASWVRRLYPEIIVFPTVGERTSLTQLAPRAAMKLLIESSVWVLYETTCAQEHLDALSRLIRQTRCFEATVGPDLFDDPSLLMRLVA